MKSGTLVNVLSSYCSCAQSERLESLQKRSWQLQTDQANSLKSLSDGLTDLRDSLRLVLEAGSSRDTRDHFTMSDINCLQEKLQSLSLSERDVQKQQAVLESLTFDSRPARHAQVPEAHKKTFKWALTTNEDPTLGPSIGAWLKQGDGIFWVSGKPGSGKSTLMKYIADSSITSSLITEWARPCRAVIVSHYFWIAGTSMQKSQQGLLQTLLYEIFRQCPDMIEQTCPERWISSESAGSWSLMELRETLHTSTIRNDADLKLCFIIDGLDEYSGDHEDRVQLCQTLKGFALSGNVKLCLSSRPWNVFKEEFGLHFPKLYMQDLTRDDIRNYISSRLGEHPRWAAVSANHCQGQWLVSEIAAKSNGVFLWVFLVTKLLREGLTNRDAFVDLRRRLESFPSELEPFFKTMLESVEPFYHSHMSTALQIANASTGSPLSFLVYNFHFQEYEDSDYAINHPIRLRDAREIEEIKIDTSWHLDSRTRGLLEVNPRDGNVNFLHRTVRDFLNTRVMHDFLVTKADSGLNFSPILSILKAHIAWIKTCCVPITITRANFGEFETRDDSVITRRRHLLELTEQALKYASEIEAHTTGDTRYHALLDELERSFLCVLCEDKCVSSHQILSRIKQAFVRERLVRFRLFEYLGSKLESDPAFLKGIKSLPIMYLFSVDPREPFRLQRGRGTDFLIGLLKSRGMDPNRLIYDCQRVGIWSELIKFICVGASSEPKGATRTLSFLLEEGILKLFLKAGADPNAQIMGPSAATVAYLEFCFDVLDQSPSIQSLYLDVLVELLRLCSVGVLKKTVDEFCTGLNNRNKDELHWTLPFLAEVNGTLQLSLGARGPETAETLQSLNQVAKRIFPLNLYTPMEVATTELSSRKRKQGSILDEQRKHQRQT